MKLRTAILAIVAISMLGLAVGPAWAPDAFATAQELFNSGQWANAANQFVTAVSANPKDPVLRMSAGVALANVKRYGEAAQQFREAERLSPDGVLPHLLLDGTYSEMGNAPAARREREAADRVLSAGRAFGSAGSTDQVLIASLAKHPRNAIAHSLLGDVYQLQGKLALAEEEYAKASDLAPKWAKPIFNLGLANLSSDAKAAEKAFGRVIELDPNQHRAYLWQGDAYLQQGKFDQARVAYSNAARDKSIQAEAQTRLGNVELRAGNYKAAQEQFGMAQSNAPQDPRPIAGQAQVLQNTGKLKDAEAMYRQSAAVQSTNAAPAGSQALVQNQIAVVSAKQGNIDDAITSLKLGFELQPTTENGYALTLAQQKASKLDAGVSSAEQALKNDPRNKVAMLYLLSAYKVNGNALGRIDVAGSLIRVDPTRAWEYYAEIGAAHMALGDTGNAVEAFIRAFDSGNAATWPDTARSVAACGAMDVVKARCEKSFAAARKVETGLILFELQSAGNDAAGMVKTADTLTQLHPERPTLWLRLGEAYERSGVTALALTAYAKAASGSDPEAAALARSRSEALRK